MELGKHLLYIIFGAAVGVSLRFFIGIIALEYLRESYAHWVTLSINIVGSFILGSLIAYFMMNKVDKHIELMLTTGFCGTFTTFSTFSVESLMLLKNGYYREFMLYVCASIILGIIAVWLGWKIFYIE